MCATLCLSLLAGKDVHPSICIKYALYPCANWQARILARAPTHRGQMEMLCADARCARSTQQRNSAANKQQTNNALLHDFVSIKQCKRDMI